MPDFYGLVASALIRIERSAARRSNNLCEVPFARPFPRISLSGLGLRSGLGGLFLRFAA